MIDSFYLYLYNDENNQILRKNLKCFQLNKVIDLYYKKWKNGIPSHIIKAYNSTQYIWNQHQSALKAFNKMHSSG